MEVDTMSANDPIKTAETMELEGRLDAKGRVILLVSYLVKGDLNNARFLWKRTPTVIKEAEPELASVWAIGRAMWEGVPATAAFNVKWSDAVEPHVIELQQILKKKALALLGKAYSVVSVDTFASRTGVSAEDAVATATELGWRYDVETSQLHATDEVISSSPAPSAVETPIELAKLTTIISHIER